MGLQDSGMGGPERWRQTVDCGERSDSCKWGCRLASRVPRVFSAPNLGDGFVCLACLIRGHCTGTSHRYSKLMQERGTTRVR
jgi:hypothetical protein